MKLNKLEEIINETLKTSKKFSKSDKIFKAKVKQFNFLMKVESLENKTGANGV